MSAKQYFSIFSLELYSYVLLFILQILSLHYVLSVLIVITLSSFMPTIETFFNCFGTRSSDAKEIITDDKTAWEIQKLRNLSRPSPPLGGKAGVAKMAPAPGGEIYSHAALRIF